ncbi:MAG: molecular chaperone Hsp90 [Oscillospiraceae bacterium]|nr:molecular chaperone Hsp90 [Oscillospiraceae bacterium]MCD7853221.1 molecular chaperone Hsp90 [Oscillospiraceae bacterium]
MNETTKQSVVEQVNALLRAPSCCAGAKTAAQAWLDARGTAQEAAAAQAMIAELEQDIMPLDGLIAFVSSEAGAKVFGAERAQALLSHAQERKAAGETFCDCPACAAVAAILAQKDAILC